MPKFLMHDFELAYRFVRLGIFDLKMELDVFTRLQRRGFSREEKRIFVRIRNARHQLHAAARTNPRFIAADIVVHRTSVLDSGFCAWLFDQLRSGRRLGAKQSWK